MLQNTETGGGINTDSGDQKRREQMSSLAAAKRARQGGRGRGSEQTVMVKLRWVEFSICGAGHFPGGPVVKTLHFQCRGARVRYLKWFWNVPWSVS